MTGFKCVTSGKDYQKDGDFTDAFGILYNYYLDPIHQGFWELGLNWL